MIAWSKQRPCGTLGGGTAEKSLTVLVADFAATGAMPATAAVAGMGIDQLPDYYVLPLVARDQLEIVLADFAPHDEPIWAVFFPTLTFAAKDQPAGGVVAQLPPGGDAWNRSCCNEGGLFKRSCHSARGPEPRVIPVPSPSVAT